MNESENIYQSPSSELDTDKNEANSKEERLNIIKKKKDRLILYIIIVTILNLVYVFIETSSKNLPVSNLIGYAIGNVFLLPSLVVLFSQIISVFRNNYIRLKIFFWVSFIIFLLKTFLVIALLSERWIMHNNTFQQTRNSIGLLWRRFTTPQNPASIAVCWTRRYMRAVEQSVRY